MAGGRHKKFNKKKHHGRSHRPKSSNNEFIGTYHEAPHYVRDNVHIFGGYRINYNTPWKILKSLFMMHNETLNIWTHLFGAIVVMIVIGYAVYFINPEISGRNGKNIHLKDKVN